MTNLTEILDRLTARGVILRAEGDRLKLNAPRGVLTEDDLAAVREHKPAILAYLTRPPVGTIRNPHVVRGRKMPPECIFDGCDGHLTRRGDLYYCDECKWYFERRNPTKPGVDVRDQNEGITTSDFLN